MKLMIAIVALASLVLVGCQSKPSLAGTWKGTGVAASGDLVLNEDGKFSMDMGMGQKMEGSWSESGTNLNLKPETVAGKPKEEALKQIEEQVKKMPASAAMLDPIKKMLNEMVFTIAEDRKSLNMTQEAAGQTMTITFEKQEAAAAAK